MEGQQYEVEVRQQIHNSSGQPSGFHACDVRVSPSEKFSRPLTGRLYDIIFSIPGNSEAGFSIGVFGMKPKGDLAEEQPAGFCLPGKLLKCRTVVIIHKTC